MMVNGRKGEENKQKRNNNARWLTYQWMGKEKKRKGDRHLTSNNWRNGEIEETEGKGRCLSDDEFEKARAEQADNRD